jgi:pantothenate synthetase
MKRTRHTAEQIIRKLQTAEQLIAQGKTIADVCRVIEETKRLTQLEKAMLQDLVAQRRETSEPGTQAQGRHGPAPAFRASEKRREGWLQRSLP